MAVAAVSMIAVMVVVVAMVMMIVVKPAGACAEMIAQLAILDIASGG